MDDVDANTDCLFDDDDVVVIGDVVVVQDDRFVDDHDVISYDNVESIA